MTERSSGLECRAILFDLDGVLVDSTASIERVWTTWAHERGLDPDTVIRAAHGRPTAETIALTAPDLDPEAEVPVLAAAELDELEGTAAISGAADLLATLSTGEWAVVTSGIHSIAEARLRFVGLPIPTVLITAEMVARGKPFPGGYLMAAERLGVEPRECIVVEDSPPGIQAARAARIPSIAVTTTHDRDALSAADHIVRGLRAIQIGRMAPGRLDVALVKG